jgi:hypothetical protein
MVAHVSEPEALAERERARRVYGHNIVHSFEGRNEEVQERESITSHHVRLGVLLMLDTIQPPMDATLSFAATVGSRMTKDAVH